MTKYHEESFSMLFIADIFFFEELHSEIEETLVTDTLVEEMDISFDSAKVD